MNRARPRFTPIALACALLAGFAVAADEDTEIRLPMTFDRVWYRAEKTRGLGKSQPAKVKGDLTVTADELVVEGDKKSVSIDLDTVAMVSFGRMGHDVDTNWTILTLEQSGTRRLVAIRDGAKLGYGQRTREIYESLRDAMKLVSAAQYDVPSGFRAYDAMDEQFVVAVPEAGRPTSSRRSS